MSCALLQLYGLVLANTIHAWRSVYAARAVPCPCIWWLHDPHEDQQMMENNDRIAAAVAVADAVVLPSPAIVTRFAERAHDNLVPVSYSLDPEIVDRYVNTFQKKADTFIVIMQMRMDGRP